MPVRDQGDRLDAVEAVLVQLLAEKFASQLVPLRSLQGFADRVQDIGGRRESLQTLIEQIDRRRKFIELNRHIR